MDGFDLYANKADVEKSHWRADAVANDMSTTLGRFGGGCLRNTSNTSGWVVPCIVAQGDTIVISFAYYCEDLATSGSGDLIVVGYNRSFQQLFSLRQNASGDISAFNAATTPASVGSSLAALTNNAWHWIEIKVKLGTNDTTGEFEVRVDDIVEIANVTGIDTFRSNELAFLSFNGSNGDCRYDDIVIMDTSGTEMNDYLGDSRIDTKTPNSDGTATDWVASAGSQFQCVDETPNAANDTTDYVYSTTASDELELQMSNFSDNPPSVHAVQIRTRASKSNAGNRTYRAGLRSGGVDSFGATLGLTIEWAWRRNGMFPLNPNGNIAWTKTAVDATQVKLETVT
jgi:hypothetical protein